MLVIDKANSTAADRAIFYVNGTRQTLSTPDQSNANPTYWGHASQPHRIGGRSWGGGNEASYYLTEFYHLDGVAATPSDFGETDDYGVWQPKAFSGSYGTIGFHLNFSDNSNTTATTLGKDTSGQGNNWTPYNFSIAAGTGNDSLVDTPTNYGEDTGAGGEVRGNYSTLNPLFKLNTAATIVNGNLQTTGGDVAFSTMLLTSGKWYVECTVTGGAGYNLCLSQPDHPAGNTPSSTNSKSIGWYYTGAVYWGAGYDYSGSVSYTTGDVIAAAIDICLLYTSDAADD